MADTTHNVEVVLSMKDMASATATQVAAAAGKIGTAFDNASMKLGNFAKTMGPLAGLFGFGASIAGAKRYMQTIEEMKTLTGGTAESVVGMTHAMEQSGLRAEETRAIMISMARKQAELAAGSQEVAKLAKNYGVELKKGPEAALISMSKQMKQGKIDAGGVVKLLEESGAKAVDLLRKGPAEVQRLFAEGREKNLHVNEQTIAQYKKLDIQMTRVKQAWTRVTSTILTKMAPVLTRMLSNIEGKIDGWVAGAERFGSFMAEHMGSMISAAKTFGKIMLANYALMKTTGKGLGARAAGMLKGGGGVGGGLIATGGVASIAKLLGKFTLAGAAAAAISGALKSAWDSSKSLRDNLRSAFGEVAKHAKSIWGAITAAFGPKSPLGQLLRWIGTGMIKAFTAAVSAVGKILHFFRIMGVMIKSALEGELIGFSEASRQIRATEQAEAYTAARRTGREWTNAAKEISAATRVARGGGPTARQKAYFERVTLPMAQKAGLAISPDVMKRFGFDPTGGKMARPTMVQDFRNSKFEIVQQFAEGFEPERIAVLFSNDLANLGERRLASGQNPQGTVR